MATRPNRTFSWGAQHALAAVVAVLLMAMLAACGDSTGTPATSDGGGGADAGFDGTAGPDGAGPGPAVGATPFHTAAECATICDIDDDDPCGIDAFACEELCNASAEEFTAVAQWTEGDGGALECAAYYVGPVSGAPCGVFFSVPCAAPAQTTLPEVPDDGGEGDACRCPLALATAADGAGQVCSGNDGCAGDFTSDSLSCYASLRTGEGTCRYWCSADELNTQGSCPTGYVCAYSSLSDSLGLGLMPACRPVE